MCNKIFNKGGTEYITAKNAEKVARAKAEKHSTDKTYTDIYTRAQERTAQALNAWQTAFYTDNKKRG